MAQWYDCKLLSSYICLYHELTVTSQLCSREPTTLTTGNTMKVRSSKRIEADLWLLGYDDYLPDSATWRIMYMEGMRPPRYPLPAIKTVIEHVPKNVSDHHPIAEVSNSIIVWEWSLCPGCQRHMVPSVAAVWDFSVSRCRENLIPHGVYVHRNTINEAFELVLEREKLGVQG